MASMLLADWRRLRQGAPGRRFQDLYEVRKRRKAQAWQHVVWLIVAAVLIVLGPIAGMVPGPGGLVIFFLGLALLARELRPAARALDWCEPRLRRGARWARREWKRAALLTRVGVCLLGLAVLAGIGYLVYAWRA